MLFAYTDEDWELVTKNNVRMRNTNYQNLEQSIEAYKEYYESEEAEGKNSIIKPSSFEPKVSKTTINT